MRSVGEKEKEGLSIDWGDYVKYCAGINIKSEMSQDEL